MSDSRMSRLVAGGVAAAGPLLNPKPFTVPIFVASAVTGASLPLLHTFLHALQPPDLGVAPGPELGPAAAAESADSEGGEPIHFQVFSLCRNLWRPMRLLRAQLEW